MVKVFSITITTQLKQNIHYTKGQEIIGNINNEAMMYDKDLKELHNQTGYKGYVFDNLYPTEKDKTYKENSIYTYMIKSVKREILEKLILGLTRSENQYLQIISVSSIQVMKDFHIRELYTFTPAIATVTEDDKVQAFILEKHGNTLLRERIVVNLIKKFKTLYGKEIVCDDFIQGIEILSNQPVFTIYKNKKFLGMKFKIFVGDSYEAQELAKLAVGTGVLEKNSCLGAGFVKAH